MLNCFMSLFLSLFGCLAKPMPSRHLSLSRSLHQSLIFVSWVELKCSFCSKCGLAWLFLRKGALMSAMLMRNYQKLIKIKKGPKVKDLLITVPCKSWIIRSHESEPNTAETGKMQCRTALYILLSAHISSRQYSRFLHIILYKEISTATIQAHNSETRG